MYWQLRTQDPSIINPDVYCIPHALQKGLMSEQVDVTEFKLSVCDSLACYRVRCREARVSGTELEAFLDRCSLSDSNAVSCPSTPTDICITAS